MNKLLVLTVAAALIIGAGCKSKSDDIFPMTVGSTWTYEGYMLMESKLASSDTWATTTTNVKVEKEATLTSGDKVYEFSHVMSMHVRMPDTTMTMTLTSYCREAGDAILSYESLDDSTGDTLLLSELTVGKTWKQEDGTAEVVAQEDVTVMAGTYSDAWKVKLTTSAGGTTTDEHHWFAPGVGLVKVHYMTTESGDSVEVHNELSEVDIK